MFIAGEWTSVNLPWIEFVPVKRASVDPSAPPLDPKDITQLGLVFSRFEFNGMPNSNYRPGDYSLQVCLVICWSISITESYSSLAEMTEAPHSLDKGVQVVSGSTTCFVFPATDVLGCA